MASAISYSPLTYEDGTAYPLWGEMLGWLLALSSMLQASVYIFFQNRIVAFYDSKKENLVNRNDSTPCSWFSDMEGERFTRRANRNTTPTKGNITRIHL